MKLEEIKVGMLVVVTDGSRAIQCEPFSPTNSLGLNKNIFEVIWKDLDIFEIYFCCRDNKESILLGNNPIHNICIKDKVTGIIYLHSAAYVTPYVHKVYCPCCGNVLEDSK